MSTVKSVLIVGIAGGTGSGKTTFTKALTKKFGDDVTVVLHDDYYKAHHELTYEERTKLNYDAPDAFDTELMKEHLRSLKAGHYVDCPIYDYTIHDRSEKTKRIYPKKVIIVEGILIFEDRELCDLMDIKVFVDTDADTRLIRRIRRDTRKRGRSLESILKQYETTVKPMHEKYVEPSRKNADIIVPEGGRNPVALDMLLSKIKKHIDENNLNKRKYI